MRFGPTVCLALEEEEEDPLETDWPVQALTTKDLGGRSKVDFDERSICNLNGSTRTGRVSKDKERRDKEKKKRRESWQYYDRLRTEQTRFSFLCVPFVNIDVDQQQQHSGSALSLSLSFSCYKVSKRRRDSCPVFLLLPLFFSTIKLDELLSEPSVSEIVSTAFLLLSQCQKKFGAKWTRKYGRERNERSQHVVRVKSNHKDEQSRPCDVSIAVRTEQSASSALWRYSNGQHIQLQNGDEKGNTIDQFGWCQRHAVSRHFHSPVDMKAVAYSPTSNLYGGVDWSQPHCWPIICLERSTANLNRFAEQNSIKKTTTQGAPRNKWLGSMACRQQTVFFPCFFFFL